MVGIFLTAFSVSCLLPCRRAAAVARAVAVELEVLDKSRTEMVRHPLLTLARLPAPLFSGRAHCSPHLL